MYEFERIQNHGEDLVREHHAKKGDITFAQGAAALLIATVCIVIFAWWAGMPLVG
jgi:hypothetical protein